MDIAFHFFDVSADGFMEAKVYSVNLVSNYNKANELVCTISLMRSKHFFLLSGIR